MHLPSVPADGWKFYLRPPSEGMPPPESGGRTGGRSARLEASGLTDVMPSQYPGGVRRFQPSQSTSLTRAAEEACEYGGDNPGPEAVSEITGLDSMSRARELPFARIAARASRPAGASLRQIVNARTLASQVA